MLAVSDITTTVAPLAHRWHRQKENKLPPSLSGFQYQRFLHDGVAGTDNEELSKCLSSLAVRSVFPISKRQHTSCIPRGTWVFFRWVCAARDSKLAPRSKKKIPLKLIPRSRIRPKTDTPF